MVGGYPGTSSVGGCLHQLCPGEGSILAFQVSSSSATRQGDVHKSFGVRVVGTIGQVKRCGVSWLTVLHRGQSGEGYCRGQQWCLYDRRKGDLLSRS